MHKASILFITGTVILLAILALFFWVQKTSAEVGNIQVFQGKAQITGGGKTSDAKTGQEVKVKDSIKVSSGSKVFIVLKDSSVIRLDENTEVEVGELSYQGQKIKDASFKLITGRLWSRVSPLEEDGIFEVETPTVVASVRGTSFNTTFNPKVSGVYVYKKLVSVALQKNRSNTQSVGKNQLLRMQNDKLDEDFEKDPVTPDPSYIDDWILFNQDADDKICKDNPQTPGCSNYFEPTPAPSLTPSPTIYKPPANKSSSPKSLPSSSPTQTPTSTKAPTPTPTSIPKKLVNFQITHDNTENDCLTSCQFNALAYFNDNPNKSVNVTKDTKWSIKSPANGSITSSGFYTQGKTRGDTIIGTYGVSSASHIIPTYTTPSIL